MAIATGAVGGQTTARRVVFPALSVLCAWVQRRLCRAWGVVGSTRLRLPGRTDLVPACCRRSTGDLGLHLAEVITIRCCTAVSRSADRADPADHQPLHTRRPGVPHPCRRRLRTISRRRCGVLGSVWTPCVGPILAGILVLALDSASLFQAIILLICYAAGLGIPFLIVGATFGASTQFCAS